MDNLWVACLSVLWLGVLTSISPCPLTQNIAAVSFLGKESRRGVLLHGLLYTAGRVFTYTGLAVLLVSSVLAAPSISQFLQRHMIKFMGPILLLAGVVLLELVPIFPSGFAIGQKFQTKVKGLGLFGAFLLGAFFALAFCPISAAIYFASLLPIVLEQSSPVLLPSLYGIGTALPVLVFSVILAFSVERLSRSFELTKSIGNWGKLLTGWVFVAIGLYFSTCYSIFA